MEQVSKLIEANKEFALQLSLKLSFGVVNKKFYGAIFDKESQVFYKVFEGEHAHILIAKIHIEFSEHLKKVDIARKRAETLKLQAERNSERQRIEEEKWQEELEKRKQRL